MINKHVNCWLIYQETQVKYVTCTKSYQLFVALCFSDAINTNWLSRCNHKTGVMLTRCFQVAVILSSVSVLYCHICASYFFRQYSETGRWVSRRIRPVKLPLQHSPEVFLDTFCQVHQKAKPGKWSLKCVYHVCELLINISQCCDDGFPSIFPRVKITGIISWHVVLNVFI